MSEYWDKVQKFILPSSKKEIGSVSLWKEYGDISIDYLNTGQGIVYSSFRGKMNEDTVVEGASKHDVSFFTFNSGADVQFEFLKSKNNVKLPSFNMMNAKHYEGHNTYMKYAKNEQYIMQHIVFNDEIFDNIMTNIPQTCCDQDVCKCDSMELFFKHKTSQKQAMLLSDLHKVNTLAGKMKEIYFESKVLELIYTSVNQMSAYETIPSTNLSSEDITRLKRAKTILLDDICNPPSLKELAYKSAINEFKLKKGFKHLFGNTVYGFIQEQRLQKAKLLLETGEINISEATSMVGYKSVSHFSQIFKKHYGIPPIHIKKQSKQYYI